MLPKKNRADKKTVEKIFASCPPHGREGAVLRSPSLTFKFILRNNEQSPRISFVVSKNTAKKAVERNRLRRLGYNILEKHIGKLPDSVAGVCVLNKSPEDIFTLENEIKTIFAKVN